MSLFAKTKLSFSNTLSYITTPLFHTGLSHSKFCGDVGSGRNKIAAWVTRVKTCGPDRYSSAKVVMAWWTGSCGRAKGRLEQATKLLNDGTEGVLMHLREDNARAMRQRYGAVCLI
jgi:hypothetical protein